MQYLKAIWKTQGYLGNWQPISSPMSATIGVAGSEGSWWR